MTVVDINKDIQLFKNKMFNRSDAPAVKVHIPKCPICNKEIVPGITTCSDAPPSYHWRHICSNGMIIRSDYFDNYRDMYENWVDYVTILKEYKGETD